MRKRGRDDRRDEKATCRNQTESPTSWSHWCAGTKCEKKAKRDGFLLVNRQKLNSKRILVGGNVLKTLLVFLWGREECLPPLDLS